MIGAVASRAITALILNKLVALFYGPIGITLLAHLQNLIVLVSTLPNDGIHRGSINLFQFASPDEKQVILKRVIFYNVLIIILFTIIILLGQGYFWEKFRPISRQINLPVFFSLTIVFIVLQQSFLTVFQADRKYFKYAVITAFSSFVVLVSGVIATVYFELEYFLIIYLISLGIGFFIAFFFYRNEYSFLFKISNKSSDKKISKPIFEFVLMAISVWLFTYFFDFIVRDFAINTFGYDETGNWQAVVKLSDQIKSVFIATVGAIFFTEISARLNDQKSLKKYIFRSLAVILPVVFMGLLIIYFIRIPILSILYADEFLEAEKYFLFQLTGDLLAITSFFFVYIIMAKRKIFTFILLQAISGAIYILFIYLFTPLYELEGIVMAHLTRYIFFLLLVVYYSRRLIFS